MVKDDAVLDGILVGYRRFYSVFAGFCLGSRFIWDRELALTAFVWATWIVVWTSPDVLAYCISWVIPVQSALSPQQHAKATRASSQNPKASPLIKSSVNGSIYYICHFYTVSSAFAFCNVSHAVADAENVAPFLLGDVVGFMMLIAGFLGTLWSRGYLGTEWRGAPEVRKDMRLITTGPYAISRHPIYTSLYMMLSGSALVARSWWSLAWCCIGMCAYAYKASKEERMLTLHFGKVYLEYRRVTSKLIPYVY